MKINKIMLILFILLAILTATAVSATDDVENMTAEAPLDEIESSDVDTVTQTDEEEQLEEKTDLDYNPDEILGEVSEDVISNESSTDFDLNVNFPKIVYGDNPNYFDAYVPENADGILTLLINGEIVEEWNDFEWYDEYDSYDIPSLNPKSTNTWEVKYSGDSSYSDTSESGTFEYKWVTISEETELSGDFHIDIEGREGVLIFLIDGKQIFNDFFKFMAWVPFENLTVGNHNYEIILYDNSNQLVFDENGTFYADYHFSPFVMEGYPLVDKIEIPIDLPDDATGNVLVSYNGENFTAEINNGMAYVTLNDLELGEKEIVFTYMGDDKYPKKTVKKVISIEGYAIVPHEDLGNNYISLTLPSTAVGKLNISLTDEHMTFKKFLDSVDLVDGTAKYVFAPGNYIIWAEYNGTGYDVEPLVYNFEVFPHIQVSDVIFGENATIDIFYSNASENFTIYIDDEEICNVTLDENGRKTLNVNTLELKKLGNHNITVSYNGTKLVNDNDHPFVVRFTVLPGTFTVPEQFGFDKSANLTVSLSEYAKGNISVLAMDSGYQEYFFAQNVSVSGNAIVPLFAEKSGDYMLFIQYVDETYGEFNIQSPVHVPKPDAGSDIAIPQTVTSDTLEINLPKNATGSILAIIDGKSQIYPLVNGSTKVDLSGVSAGPHNIVIKYAGDANYEKFERTADFTIKKATVITAKPISVVYKNNVKWTINLKDADNKAVAGQTIKVTINGKTYTGMTNAKGNAVVTIPANLVPKIYTAKIVFAGTTGFLKDSKNVKFTVKKATPKMTAKKKTFKKKIKTKKYTIVLKDNKGKAIKKAKVTLKIKGKKAITVKTNAKGKATFKIKKLTKKGTFKSVITYKGNAYYKKVTKKVKIKVK